MSVYEKTTGIIKTEPAGFFSKIKWVFNCSYIYISISSKGKKNSINLKFSKQKSMLFDKKSKLFEKVIKFWCVLINFVIV